MRFLSTVSLFRVNVPVLSLQSTSIPAISSIAVILFVIAPCRKKRRRKGNKLIEVLGLLVWLSLG